MGPEELPGIADAAADPSCRLCLLGFAGQDAPGCWALFEADLPQKLMAFADVQIQENDGLPTIICTNCRDMVCMAYDFKCQVEKSDHDLRQALLAKQSTLNTQWPTVPIMKSHETASAVEAAVIPCLQNNIINSCITIQDDYAKNNNQQFNFKITTDNTESESCEKQNVIQQSDSVEIQSVVTDNSVLPFQVDNVISANQSNHKINTQCEMKAASNNENNDSKLESKSIEENSNQSDDEKPLILRTKRHKCKYCIKSFANLILLENHAVIHKQQRAKVYICYLCDEEFTSADKIKSHAMKIHDINVDKAKIIENAKIRQINGLTNGIYNNSNNQYNLSTEKLEGKNNIKFICKLCNRILTSQKLLLSHIKCHPNYKDKLLNYKNALVGEAASHPTNTGAALQSASYLSNSEAASHPADLKTASYPVNAEVAPQSTNSEVSSQDNTHKVVNLPHKDIDKSSMNDDELNDDDENGDYDDDDDDDDDSQDEDNNSLGANIQCNQCGKLVATHRNLKRHLLTHSGLKYNCSICNKDFSRPDKLKEHQQLKHKEEVFGKSDSDDCSNDKNAADSRKKEKDNRPHKCKVCPKAFAQPQSLANHEERHKRVRDVRKRYLCEVCSKCFAQSGSLVAHMRTHTGVKPYVCNVCSRAFTKSTYLQLHLRTHSGEKPYICQYCSRAFARANTLARHITMHTGEAKYKCQICSKLFRRLTSLNEHMYTHTGQRPYACKICSKRYNNAGSLYAHTKKCKSAMEASVNSANTMSDQISFELPDDSIIPSNDDNIPSQILIFTDKKIDEVVTDEAIMAEAQTCQFMITNMHSQRPVSTNVFEQFTIQDSDIYNINSKQFKMPYYGLYPSM